MSEEEDQGGDPSETQPETGAVKLDPATLAAIIEGVSCKLQGKKAGGAGESSNSDGKFTGEALPNTPLHWGPQGQV